MHCAHLRNLVALHLKHKWKSKNNKINDSVLLHKPCKIEERSSPVCFEMAVWQPASVSASDVAALVAGTAAGETGCCWSAGTAGWLETAAAAAAAAGDSE